MDRLTIIQGHDSQKTANLLDKDPITDTAIWLYFTANRMQQSKSAPFALYVGSFPQYLFFEVSRRFHVAFFLLPRMRYSSSSCLISGTTM